METGRRIYPRRPAHLPTCPPAHQTETLFPPPASNSRHVAGGSESRGDLARTAPPYARFRARGRLVGSHMLVPLRGGAVKVRRLLSLIAVVAASLVGRDLAAQSTDVIRGKVT